MGPHKIHTLQNDDAPPFRAGRVIRRRVHTQEPAFRRGSFRGRVIWCLALFCIACATKAPPPVEPVPAEYPGARLVFDRIESVTPHKVSLLFRLEADNPLEEAIRIHVEDWKATVNGVDQAGEGTLIVEGGVLAAGSSGAYPLRWEAALSPDMIRGSTGSLDGEAALAVDILFTLSSGGEYKTRITAAAAFPLIREPEVRITAIAVKKAELINTRFKVSLKIDNPNIFPLELSAFSYQLYNAGRLWADGAKTDILLVPPEGSAETALFLTMNFINMSRELLNQVVSMRDIHYRFTGEARISTGIDYLPPFRMIYDLAGYSEVIE
jgi:LEA14-like dessication related protein